MRMVRYLCLMIILIVTGCIPLTPPVQRTPFPVSEYKVLNTKGTGIVKGQAFLKTRGGDVKVAAGNEILLNPVTSYSRQWYEVAYLQNRPMTMADPRYEQYILTTIADAEGKFEFTNVPPGEYYLVAPVFWEAAVGYQGSLVRQGGYIAKKITVQNSDELKLILTK